MNDWILEFNGDRRPLAGWGIESFSNTRRNLDADELTLSMRGAALATEAPKWAHLDKLVLWRGSVRKFTGWVTQRPAFGSAEAHQYVVSGPWWWLANTPFITKSKIWNPVTSAYELALSSSYGVSNYDMDTQTTLNVQAQVLKAINCVMAASPGTIAVGTLDATVKAPWQKVKDSSCAEVIKSAAHFAPDNVFWWDYSPEVPVCYFVPRASLSAAELDLEAGNVEDYNIGARDDLLIKKVVITYEYPYEDDPTKIDTWHDSAGDLDWPDGPGALRHTFSLGSKAEFDDRPLGIAARLLAAYGTLAYDGQLIVRETTALPDVRPGVALNVLNGVSAWATMRAVVQEATIEHSARRVDTLSVKIGPPDHLGPQDYFAMEGLGRAGSSSGDSESAAGRIGGMIPGPGGESGGTYRGLLPPFSDNLEGGLSFSSLAATGELIGYNEYTDTGVEASVPPKRYRAWTMSGTTYGDVGWPVGTCTRHYVTASGVNEYDKTTGVLVEGIHVNNNGAVYAPTGTWGAAACYAVTNANTFAGARCTTESNTKKTAVITLGDGTCGPSEYGCVSCRGKVVDTLSVEDTDEDALDRAEASVTWSGWSPTAVGTAYQNRVSGYSVYRRRVKIRGTYTGGQPFYPYTAEIQLESRPYGAGAWSDAQKMKVALVAGADGTMELSERELPIEKGQEFRIKSAEVHAG